MHMALLLSIAQSLALSVIPVVVLLGEHFSSSGAERFCGLTRTGDCTLSGGNRIGIHQLEGDQCDRYGAARAYV